MTRILLVVIACLVAGPGAVSAKGLILGYEFQNYFAMDPATGDKTDLGIGPPGRGDYLPQDGKFAVTAAGCVYALQSNSEFEYDPFVKQGERLGFRDSFLEDFAQGPNGEVYLLEPFGDLEVVDPNTRDTLHSFSGILRSRVAATSDGEVVLTSGDFFFTLDVSTGQQAPLDTFVPGVGMPTPGALGADAEGSILFTSIFPRDEIYRIDPGSGELDAVPVDFDPRHVEFISPGPERSVILGGRFEGVRRVELATGATLWSVPWGQHFTPEFAVYTTAIPEPASAALALAACAAAAARRRQISFSPC